MSPQPPTPEDAEHVMFILRWWQEFLGGLILTITGLYFKSKGKNTENAIIPMSEEEIEHRLTICRQSVFLDIHNILDERDRRLEQKLDRRDELFLQKIEKLHIRLNKEAGLE